MDSVLQYEDMPRIEAYMDGRNPCFNGQCFAIGKRGSRYVGIKLVAILVLMDSVLQ